MKYELKEFCDAGHGIIGPGIDCDFVDGWISRVSFSELRDEIIQQLEKAYLAGFEEGHEVGGKYVGM